MEKNKEKRLNQSKTFLCYCLIAMIMKCVLMCEDNSFRNEHGCEGIREKFPEYEVVSTYSGEDSIDQVASRLEDLKLVLTDGQLAGDMKGWDLAKELRTLGYKGPIVYIGASVIPGNVEEGLFTASYLKQLGGIIDLKRTFASIAEQHL